MSAAAPVAVASSATTIPAMTDRLICHLSGVRRATRLPYDFGMPPRKKPVRRKKVAPGSIGLTTAEAAAARAPELDQLAAAVEADGGAVIGRYNDPFGGKPLLVAAL